MPTFQIELCKERIWNQGKAQRKYHILKKRLCKERIWNQGKAISIKAVLKGDCAKSGFGIKAKPRKYFGGIRFIVQRADLESRQS